MTEKYPYVSLTVRALAGCRPTTAFTVCPKRNRRVPEGDRCPLCEAEERNPGKSEV